MKTAVLIYYPEQVGTLKNYLAHQEATVVALGAEIEHALTEAGVPFYSAESLRTVAPLDRLAQAERVAQGVFADPHMQFLSYRSVAIGKAHALGVQQYVAVLSYYLDIINTLVERERPEQIAVLQSGRIAFLGDVLADEMEGIVEVAARLVASARRVSVKVIPSPHRTRVYMRKVAFVVRRMLFGAGLGLMNALVSILVQPKPLRLLVTDIWRNAEPYLTKLPDAEVVLWERTEAQKVGWGTILKHRMRFMHADAFGGPSDARAAKEMLVEWENVRNNLAPLQGASFVGISLEDTVRQVVDFSLRTGIPKDVQDVDDMYRMLKRLKPQVVLVRASESLQTHFPFLCQVAEALAIPAVEVQHGLLYLGPGSFASQHAAKHIATYEPLSSREFAALGVPETHATGSPRFDRHATPLEPGSTNRLTITYVLSTLTPGWWIDSYDVRQALVTLARATAALDADIRVSVRADSPYAPFLRQTVVSLGQMYPHFSLSTDPVTHLIPQSDIVVLGFSTVLLEALFAGKLVIYDGTMPMYGSMIESEAIFSELPLPRATSEKELAEVLVRFADSADRQHMQTQLAQSVRAAYIADGTAGERLAALVRTLAG